MKETVNLLAAAFALLIAVGLGWLAWIMNQPEPVAEVVIPKYRVGYPLLEKWLSTPPKVVCSKSLPKELTEDMELQCRLLVVVTGLGQQQSSEEMVMAHLDRLRRAFPEAKSATVTKYNERADGHYPSVYDTSPYYIDVTRSTNQEMVNDFRHTVRNASIDEIDYVIENLEFKMDSWKNRLSKIDSSSVSNAQFLADTAFLKQMPAYISEWVRLKRDWKEFSEKNPDIEAARIQWASFERKQLPVLNAYIEGNQSNKWSPNHKGVIEAELPSDAALYLQVEIAGRTLYLPLNPPGDPRLGLTMASLAG